MQHAELLATYRATHWAVRLPASQPTVRIGEPAPDPLLRATAVITAYNPGSRWRSAAENERANRALLQELLRAGAQVWPAVAQGLGDEPERWTEPGFVVRGLPRAAAVALAGRYGQNAIVWTGGDGVPTLVATRPGFCGARPGDTLVPPQPHGSE